MSQMYFSALCTTCCKCAMTDPTLSVCSPSCSSPNRAMNSQGREDISCDKRYSMFCARNLNEGTKFTMILPNEVRLKSPSESFCMSFASRKRTKCLEVSCGVADSLVANWLNLHFSTAISESNVSLSILARIKRCSATCSNYLLSMYQLIFNGLVEET